MSTKSVNACQLCEHKIGALPVTDEDCLSLLQDLVRWQHVPSHIVPRPKKLKLLSKDDLRDVVQRASDWLVGIRKKADSELDLFLEDVEDDENENDENEEFF